MRYLTLIVLALVTQLAALGQSARAGEPARVDKIRVLLTSGGHGFEQKAFYAMFDAMADIQYTKAELPKDLGLLKPGLEKKFDCIVMYDMCPNVITPEQQNAFLALLKTGIAVVSLHHNVGAHRDWDEWRKIIGGKFVFGDREIDGKPYKKTPWAHGQNLKVTVVKKHPITKGIEDFEIHDETYGVFYTAPDIQVLLTTDHPNNNRELAWTTSYGQSPVFFLMLGHDAHAYRNPNFSKLVHQGIRWAASQ